MSTLIPLGATRFYLQSTGTPAVSPAFDSGWGNTTSAVRLPCSTTKAGTSFSDLTVSVANTTGGTLFYQFVSDPISADLTSLNFFFAAAMRAMRTGGALALVPFVFRIMDGSGIATKFTSRNWQANTGGIYPDCSAYFGSGSPAPLNTIVLPNGGSLAAVQCGDESVRFSPSASAANSLVISTGDIFVFEIGLTANGLTTSGVMECGDPASDDIVPRGGTPTDALNPWFDFVDQPGVPINNTKAWLVVNEPSIGLTDRSSYLFLGDGAQHSFNLQARQRGNASYTLRALPGDAYLPTIGSPIYLYDVNALGSTLVFSGLIQDFTPRWVGIDGLRYIDVTAVSLESVFDTVYAPPFQYVNETCGFIVADLLSRLESGCPVTAGTISAGATIPLVNTNYEKISDLFDQLAITSGFIWGVNPQTSQLYFCLPSAQAAPFDLTSTESLWDSISDKLDGAEYRNRQAVRLSYDAFPHSAEFFIGSNQQSFTLRHPVNQVINAYVTLSTPNTATGTFSGQPSPGDTITIGPASGAWQATHIYGLGGVIVVEGIVQQVTTAGTSGGTIPTFATITGDTTSDGSAIWTCQGPLGLSTGNDTYTFVSTLDNTQFGGVLIGTSSSATCKNLADAINANAAKRTVTISLPTWENSQCNAIYTSGAGFTLQQKFAGSGWVAALSKSCANFSWSGAVTSGGTSPQGSVGPNEPATISISVYASGTSTAAPGLAYTQGSAVVRLATPLNSGTNLNIEYTRADGNVIEVENTPLVVALAIVTGGTGKVQQITDQTQAGLVNTSAAAGLQFAQEALAAYDVVPNELEVHLLQPGILPGQAWVWNLSGELAGLNATYFVEEVRAELIPTYPYLDNPNAIGAGHYRYTVKVVDIAQIASYMDFWEQTSGGSGGGGQGAALAATSGGGISTAASQTGGGGGGGGVTSLIAGTGVHVSASTGTVTVSIGQAVETTSGVQFATIGVGVAGGTTALEVAGAGQFHDTGVSPDNSYHGCVRITRASANTAQYINLVRSGTSGWSIGTIYNSSSFAIGLIQATESSFTTPALSIDTGGNVALSIPLATSSGGTGQTSSGTSSQVLIGGSTPAWSNVNLAGAMVVGVLPIANGGTAQSTAITNWIFAGPASGPTGPPLFRGMVAADLPSIASGLTGQLPIANGGTGASSASAARTALGLGTAAVQNVSAFLQPSNNLSDVSSLSFALANLGLSSSDSPSFAGLNTGTSNVNLASGNIFITGSGPGTGDILTIGNITCATLNVTSGYEVGGVAGMNSPGSGLNTYHNFIIRSGIIVSAT